jgi:glycerol-3-phosphate acyltransferase PlsY
MLAWATVAIAVLLFWRHRTNIRQLISGRETTIGR